MGRILYPLLLRFNQQQLARQVAYLEE